MFSFTVLIILYTVMLRKFKEVTESVKDANSIESMIVMPENLLKEKTFSLASDIDVATYYS